jgi:antitoxin FitA
LRLLEGKTMGSITIRRLDDDLKERLRQRAARHGRSMEDEVREVLRITLAMDAGEPDTLAERIQARFGPLGGVELDLPEREPPREPPGF